MTGRAIAVVSGLVAVAMTLLMLVGTTSVGLFLAYGGVWILSACVLAWALRREKAETFARLERERRGQP